MDLLRYLLKSRYAARKRIFISPEIPQKELTNAIAGHEWNSSHGSILVLVDDTVMGSGKDGCIICSTGISTKEAFQPPRFFSFEHIHEIALQGKKLFINGHKVFTLHMVEDAKGLFALVGEWLKSDFNDEEPSAGVTQDNPLNNDLTREQINDILSETIEFSRRNRIERVYSSPDIPLTKLSAAISSYGHNIQPNQVAILIDDTILGGSKEGVLITSEIIAIKTLFTESLVYPMSRLEAVVLKGNNISIGAHTRQFTQTGEKELGALFMFLNHQLYSARKASQKHSVAPLASVEFSANPNQFAPSAASTSAPAPLPAKAGITNSIPASLIADVPPTRSQELTAAPSKKGITDQVFEWISNNRDPILKLLREKAGDLSIHALRDDDNMRAIASFLYGLLPTVLRVVLKEHVFVQFVLDNRNKLIESLNIQAPTLETRTISLETSQPIEAHPSKATLQSASSKTAPSADKLVASESKKNTLKTMLKVQNELRACLNDDPDMDIHITLALNNLNAATLAIIKTASNDDDQQNLEFDVLMLTSLLFGLSYHSLPNTIKNLSRTLGESESVFLIGMAILEGIYREITEGASFSDDESDAGMFISMAAVLARSPKERVNQQFKEVINKSSIAKNESFSGEYFRALINQSKGFSAQWADFVMSQNIYVRDRLWTKWAAAFSDGDDIV